MITVPTNEFLGLLGDVVSFALDDEDWPELCCVRLAWDGDLLHAQAHDGQHLGWSRWSPDDDPDTDVQESMLQPWGGDDGPWAALIRLEYAKLLLKTYKVPTKIGWVPLTVGMDRDRLRVSRDRFPGLMANTSVVDLHEATFADFAEILGKLDRVEPQRSVAFTAALLAHFADVRPRGPLVVSFTGEHSPALVSVGERFTGAIHPVRKAAERRLKAA